MEMRSLQPVTWLAAWAAPSVTVMRFYFLQTQLDVQLKMCFVSRR